MCLELLEVRGETLQPTAAPGVRPPLWPELPLAPRRGSQKLALDLLRLPQAWLHQSKTRASPSGFGSHLTTPPRQTPESVLERRLGIVRAALWHMDRRGLGRREKTRAAVGSPFYFLHVLGKHCFQEVLAKKSHSTSYGKAVLWP